MKSVAVLALATLLLVLFFQCCPSAAVEEPSIQAPTEQRAPEATQPTFDEQTAAPATQPTPAEPTAAPPPPEPTPTSPPPSPTPAPQPVSLEFSGRGDEATQLFRLDTGLMRCNYTHVGESNFIVWLLDSQGNMVAGVANEIGSCEGSSAESIRSNGDYLLAVTADGDWTFRCEANAPGGQPSPRQPAAVAELSGYGDEATDFIHLESGLARWDYQHDGQSNFIVWLLDSQGNMVAGVANEIGSCEGSSADGVRSGGEFLLDVMADGNWTITLSQ